MREVSTRRVRVAAPGSVRDVGDTHPGSGREETEGQRLDRNLGELLGELRVALPGVQVLFAFLLVVPFNQGFSKLTKGEERLYLATLLFAALATTLLIAPTAYHRLTFHLQDKRYLVSIGNRYAIGGLACLAVAMSLAILLVTSVVFGGVTGTVVVAGVAIGFSLAWFVLPLVRRRAVSSGHEKADPGT
jgi:hypothetical protein